MKSICALIENVITDTGKDIYNALDPVGTSVDSLKTIGSGTAKLAGHVASGVGSGLYNLAGTSPVRNTLFAAGGLALARGIGKKLQDREKNSQSNLQPKYKAPPKFESVDKLSEQNENLPRFPQLSYINKIPKSPRSVASFFMRRKPNTYDANAADQSIEAHRKISSRFVKRSAASTGVDRVVGKLTA